MAHWNPHTCKELETGEEVHPRNVSKPKTHTGKGAARNAGESDPGPHQLLRSERERATTRPINPVSRALLA